MPGEALLFFKIYQDITDKENFINFRMYRDMFSY